MSHARKLLTFRRNFLPPSSEHKESSSGEGIRDPEDGGNKLLLNVGKFSLSFLTEKARSYH